MLPIVNTIFQLGIELYVASSDLKEITKYVPSSDQVTNQLQDQIMEEQNNFEKKVSMVFYDDHYDMIEWGTRMILFFWGASLTILEAIQVEEEAENFFVEAEEVEEAGKVFFPFFKCDWSSGISSEHESRRKASEDIRTDFCCFRHGTYFTPSLGKLKSPQKFRESNE